MVQKRVPPLATWILAAVIAGALATAALAYGFFVRGDVWSVLV